ncbi:MAG: PilZ domain-containing protein [Desulfobacteraceae bacterium]|nr:PilZ domain-containing protein [Desulfobacteraceae bacterium]
MQSFEKIPKESVASLIEALIKEKRLVKMAVPGTDLEQLTIITGIKNDRSGACFQIDPPEELKAALQKKSLKTLTFEFSNEARLTHRFEAEIRATGQGIWISLPEYIERYQLRNNFRIKAPANAQAVVMIEDAEITMVVDNISLGGIYCHCPNSVKESITPELTLDNMELIFSFGGGRYTLSIDRAIVRRIEGRTRPRSFGLAFEFLRLNTTEKVRLTEIVYELQRDYLRNRLRYDE